MEMMGRRYNKRLDWQGSVGVNDSSKREEELSKIFGDEDGKRWQRYYVHLQIGPVCEAQWRRQDLLQGGAKLEIMSWGTLGGLQRRLQQLIDD